MIGVRELPRSPLTDLSPQAQRAIGFLALIAVVPALNSLDGDFVAWMIAGIGALFGESVYTVVPSDANPLQSAYPYLPNYALFISLVQQPVKAVITLGYIEHLTTPEIFYYVGKIPVYIGYIALVLYGTALIPERVELESIVLLGFYPLFLEGVAIHGSDVFMTGVLIAGLYYAYHDEWMIAGVCIGFSTFKFLTIPIAIAFAISLLVSRSENVVPYIKGGIISQIPNILYFITHIQDFLYVLHARGALTKSSHTAPKLLPFIDTPALETLYSNLVFPIIILVFIAVAARQYMKDRYLVGSLIGLFPMIFLVPAEFRPKVFIALLLLTLFLLENRTAWIIAGGLWFLQYWQQYSGDTQRWDKLPVVEYIESHLDMGMIILILIAFMVVVYLRPAIMDDSMQTSAPDSVSGANLHNSSR